MALCLFSTKFFCRYFTLEFEHKFQSSSSKLIIGRTEKTQVSFSPDINHSLRRKLRRCEEEKDATCSAP